MTTLARGPQRPPSAAASADATPAVWWRLPIVWLVIGGPALVVVASFITLALAIRNPDPVLNTPAAKSKAEQPAVQGRNHAATPGR
jgi:uncharacterized protein